MKSFNYKGHAGIRHFQVESVDKMVETHDLKPKLSAKENRLSFAKRNCAIVNVTEEAFDLAYENAFGVCGRTVSIPEPKAKQEGKVKARIWVTDEKVSRKTTLVTVTEETLDMWSTRLYL